MVVKDAEHYHLGGENVSAEKNIKVSVLDGLCLHEQEFGLGVGVHDAIVPNC